jgi:hypothetical protein
MIVADSMAARGAGNRVVTRVGEMTEKLLNRTLYFGVALVAMSSLMFELTLVRIFSVTLWYHFAFMAISIAMLGIGAAGIYVYVFAPARSQEHTLRRLAVSSLALSVTAVAALVIQLNIRFIPSFSLKSFVLLAQVYLVIAVPFFFGGLCVSLVARQAPEMIPWVWGINGATSVFASVISIGVAINWGFSAAMMVGLFSYAVALVVVSFGISRRAP